MILRLSIGFFIGLTFAACDRDNPYVPGGLDLMGNQRPIVKTSIVCCRCNQSVCKAVNDSVCPPGWEPKAGEVNMNAEMMQN